MTHLRTRHIFAIVLLAAMLLPVSFAFAQYSKMMVVGNSLTHHFPASGADGLSWDGNWGMAASVEANDYVHRLQTMLQANQVGVPLGLDVGHIADERYTMTGTGAGSINLSGAPTLTASNADLMVFQLGENYLGEVTWEAFGQNYKNTIQEVAAGGNNPQVYIVGPWWDSQYTYKSMLIQEVAYSLGAKYVRIDDISKVAANLGMNEPYAAPSWSYNGVGGHPGDTGMARIAERIYGAMTAPEPVVHARTGTNLLTNGSFEDADVPDSTAVPAQTVNMNGWGQAGINPHVVNVDGDFDRTGDDFVMITQVDSIFQVAGDLEAQKKYTFLVDYGYSVHWFNLADSAYAAIAEYDAEGNWIRDLVITDALAASQSGIATQAYLEYVTGEDITAGHQIGVRLGVATTPAGGCGVLWDNAWLAESNVPEPTTLSLVALGGVALLRRRNK